MEALVKFVQEEFVEKKDFPKFLQSGFAADKAADFEFANDTAKVAFAPRFFLFSLPSKFINILSILD